MTHRPCHAERPVLIPHSVRAILLAFFAYAAASSAATPAVTAAPPAAGALPIPCSVTATCGSAGLTNWITQGSATWSTAGSTMTIAQQTAGLQLNWSSFNIGSGATVNFVQPNSSSVAINRIYQQDASQIFGALKANGSVYLLNPNGFLFGQGSITNVGGLVASSLNISPEALSRGLAGASLLAAPAFQPFLDDNGQPISGGAVTVAAGANISAPGGQVMLFAPEVVNNGSISTPDGQTLIGAGQRIFLAASTDPDVRGLLIEVGSGGTATNGTSGVISADRGNVTIAGLAVNQMGRVSATTTVNVNGTVILKARDTTASTLNQQGNLQYDETGTLTLGPDSVTAVNLEGSSSQTAVDVTPQPKSRIDLFGANVLIEDRAAVLAKGGNVNITASSPAGLLPGAPPDSSRVYLAPGSVIDVSGATDVLPMSANTLTLQLRGSELADSPQQRDGALRCKPDVCPTISVDLRRHGVNPDGSVWVGTPLANLTADVAAIPHDVFYRNLTAGTVNITSTGAVVQSNTSTINISGGLIQWQDGYVKSSIVLGDNGIAYDISNANPDRTYVGTLDTVSTSDPHWGTAAAAAQFGRDPKGVYTAGYSQGFDAGAVHILAPQVVLGGQINGSVTRGPMQVNPATSVATGQLYRWADEVPLGGLLTIGNVGAVTDTSQTEVTGSVTFAPVAWNSLVDSTGQAYDPTTGSLPVDFTSVIGPGVYESGGPSRIEVYSQGTITVPKGTDIQPGAGGSVTLVGQRVEFDGSIVAPSAQVLLEALPTLLNATAGSALPMLHVGADALIDVSGGWVNEGPVAGGQTAQDPHQAKWISGGSIGVISQQGSLLLDTGSRLYANGGALRDVSGAVVAGRGGAIRIVANPGLLYGSAGVDISIHPTLSAFALGNGGSLTLGVPTGCLTEDGQCDQAGAIPISTDVLTEDGFSSVTLGATGGSFTIDSSVGLTAQQKNWQLLSAAATHASAPSLSGLTRNVLLPDYLRNPMSLGFFSTSLNESYGDLIVAHGASLGTDPFGSISLKTDSRIIDEGQLYAPGGSITLRIAGLIQPPQYRADQGIWLADGASLDVSGVTVYRPNALGLLQGTVASGGSVVVSAGSGYVYLEDGTSIKADGTSGNVDIRTSVDSSTYDRVLVGSAGGSITLQAAEGMVIDSLLSAHAGVGTGSTGLQPAGGTLAIGLDGNLGGPGGRLDQFYPIGDPVLTVTSGPTMATADVGAAAPDALVRNGFVSADTINAGGFDRVSLSSATEVTSTGSFLHTTGLGTVAFESDVALSTGISLQVDAARIRGLGDGSVFLAAPYVRLGNLSAFVQDADTTLHSGLAQLEVDSSVLDLVGTFSLDGFANAQLGAYTDLRLIGMRPGVDPVFAGALYSSGALSLVAQQIYPTTLSQFSINLINPDPTQSALSIQGIGGTLAPVLSAAGSITLNASSVHSSGTLIAPFGSITINAADIQLFEGSVTSVSGKGLTVPFGETQGGLDWVYPLGGGYTQIYSVASSNAALPPQKQVNLRGDHINIQSGAKVDVSGGGDLLAFEFTAGLNGSRDVLSNSVSPTLYAIVPGLNLPVAPIDPLYDTGFGLATGTSVYLAGGGGLPAGTYTLLPARYALLPGAYLVQAVGGYSDLSPLSPLAQLNGGIIMAGALAVGGTEFGATRTSGFLVQPGQYALKLASYTTTLGNEFFSAQAAAAGVSKPRLPIDAGALSLVASNSITLNGVLEGSHSAGARGATVSIAGADLYVTDTNATEATPAGYVALNASELNGLGAERLVLGANETSVAGGVSLGDVSSTVLVSGAAQLHGQDLVIVANDAITVESGGSLTANGAAVASAGTVALPGGSALLEVSTGHAPVVVAGAGANSAAIDLAAGSTVAATGALALYSGGAISLGGQINATGAEIELGAPQVALGNAPAGFAGLDIDDALIQTLGAARLTINSPNAVAIYGSPTATLASLDLQTPGLVLQADAGSVNLSAGTMSLANPYASTTTLENGAASLSLSTETLSLSGGAFTISGAATTHVSATNGIVAAADTSLSVAGDLTVTAPSWSATRDANTAVAATGALVLDSATAAHLTNAASGAAFVLSGASVDIATQISAHSGLIAVNATSGSVTLESGATLDAAGSRQDFAGMPVSIGGGTVLLSAAGGDINLKAGSKVDVSKGTGEGDGGSLHLTAASGAVLLDGSVVGTSGTAAHGANLAVDASIVPFADLLSLNANGNFRGDWSVRQRGPGDLNIAQGSTLKVDSAALEADQGSISIAGIIDARSALGGSVAVSASADVRVAGSILTDATGSSQRGGHIALTTTNGGLYLDPTSTLSVAGTAADGTSLDNGTVLLTASRDTILSAADPANSRFVAAGVIRGARDLAVEGVQRYDTGGIVDASVETADVSNPIYADAQNFVLAAQPIVASMLPSARVAPGIEIDSAGDLHVTTGWNLAGWRFGVNGDAAGVLTLRAAGNLYIDKSLSDGFAGLTSGTLLTSAGPSFAYRLVGGADLGAASALAVSTDPNAGSVFIAPGIPGTRRTPPQSTAVRTGSGFIDVMAAGDIVLGNAYSVIYSAGVADPSAVIFNDRESGLRNATFPIHSGDVRLSAGRDVVGAASSQLFNDWLWRSGVAATQGRYAPTAWTPSYANFSQGIASFGGGDVTVTASRNVLDLNAAVPTIGIPRGNGAPDGTQTVILGQGLLDVTAGNDVRGGRLLGMGAGLTITAGGSVTSGADIGGNGALYPILAIADDPAIVRARRDATIEAVVNPTFLPRSQVQPVRSVSAPQYISTYGNASLLSLGSAGGNTTLAMRIDAIANESPGMPFLFGISDFFNAPLRTLPGSVELLAYSGNVTIANSVDLVPSPFGSLNLFAGESIIIGSETGRGSIHVNQSDLNPALLGTLATPGAALDVLGFLDTQTAFYPEAHAPSPVHGGAYASNGLADTEPNRWVALHGDIAMQPSDVNGTAVFLSAKPVDIYAGNDIINLGLSAQNLDASSVDTITAGRDIIYTAGRTANGDFVQNTRAIDVAGPGALLVEAGRDVNLQTSYGITTSGNLSNVALPSQGADLAVVAGANGGPRYDAFAQKYVITASTYDDLLYAYIGTLTGSKPTSKAEALATFATLTDGQKRHFLDRLFVAEVRSGGRSAAAAGDGHNDFTRAFTALETLFPGSNPDLGKGETNPNQGDILLYFSRIYTLAGGDINLFAPGGQINVGLAAAPTAFGINKPASQLGIVAQQTGSVGLIAYNDIQVNQSRIFAADGGNILIWSTEGNIDAGRGAKSAISAPPPIITVSPDGRVTTVFPAALTGSGIQTLATSTGTKPGDVDLFAPHGVVNANDAGIVAGNLTIAATAVIGSNNISVSGSSVGVPVQSSGLGVSVAAAGSSGAAATSVASQSSEGSERQSTNSVAQAALSYLDVVVVGLGEDNCRPDDVDCMRRQKHN